MSSSQTVSVGSKISVISKLGIRYEGILYTVDTNDATIALAKVRSFGTEKRPTSNPVAARHDVYEYIIFKASDIKDVIVRDTPKMHILEGTGHIVFKSSESEMSCPREIPAKSVRCGSPMCFTSNGDLLHGIFIGISQDNENILIGCSTDSSDMNRQFTSVPINSLESMISIQSTNEQHCLAHISVGGKSHQIEIGSRIKVETTLNTTVGTLYLWEAKNRTIGLGNSITHSKEQPDIEKNQNVVLISEDIISISVVSKPETLIIPHGCVTKLLHDPAVQFCVVSPVQNGEKSNDDKDNEKYDSRILLNDN